MDNSQKIEQLIECLVHVIGRSAVTLQEVQRIVGTTPKQVKAFNLCDGKRTQMEIVKATRIDQGSLSRSITRWVENGVLFRIGEGKNVRPLHIYPIPASSADANRKKRARQNN